MLANFRVEIDVFSYSIRERMLNELDQRMMPFETHAGAKAEFENLMQSDNQGLREFSRRVRSLDDVANANAAAQARDDMNREQFVVGLYDVEVQELLLREKLGSLELVIKASRARNRRRLHFPRVVKTVPAPVALTSRGGKGHIGRAYPSGDRCWVTNILYWPEHRSTGECTEWSSDTDAEIDGNDG